MSPMNRISVRGLILPVVAAGCLLCGLGAYAQVGGYKVGEDQKNTAVSPPDSPPASGGDSQSSTEPQREARIDYLNGNVTWRPDERSAWKRAATSLPLRQGAQIWVTDGGRAELRFNDGSLLRVGTDSVVTLQSLYSDAQGEFTQVKMISGLVTLRPKQERSVFQIDTPALSVTTSGPSRVRVGIADTVEVGVRWGKATLSGKQGKITLNAGEFTALNPGDTRYTRLRLPREDAWERWNDERDHLIGRPGYGYPYRVYAPRSTFFFGLDIPIGGRWHGWGRGDRR